MMMLRSVVKNMKEKDSTISVLSQTGGIMDGKKDNGC